MVLNRMVGQKHLTLLTRPVSGGKLQFKHVPQTEEHQFDLILCLQTPGISSDMLSRS